MYCTSFGFFAKTKKIPKFLTSFFTSIFKNNVNGMDNSGYVAQAKNNYYEFVILHQLHTYFSIFIVLTVSTKY